mgnify:CR=1 FL=1
MRICLNIKAIPFLHFVRHFRIFVPCPNRGKQSAFFAVTYKVCCFHTCSVLRCEYISDHFSVPHSRRYLNASTVQLTACVSCSVCAISVNFERKAVVKPSSCRSAANCNSAEYVIITTANSKFTAYRGEIMSMILPNKFICIFKVHRFYLKYEYHLLLFDIKNALSPPTVGERNAYFSSLGYKKSAYLRRLTAIKILECCRLNSAVLSHTPLFISFRA